MTEPNGGPGRTEVPWWQRPRKLRRQLAGTLVLVAFVSVATVGGLNFYGASRLLDDGNEESLSGIGEAQARTIESGAERLFDGVSAVAADLAVVEALGSLTDGFRELSTETLDPEQSSELDAFYDKDVIAPLEDAGLGPVVVGDVAPRSDEGRYLQYHYSLARDSADPEARREVADAGDGSAYSVAHREVHPYLAGLASTFGASDLLLISADGTVVYTVEKRIDLGTSLDTGPYSESELAGAVLDDLVRVRVGESVVADYQRYLPGGGRPRLFATAAVRNETEIIGSIAVQIPIDALNAITAADGRWEEVGLRGGESYVVGSDLVLRSESREWIENPDGYLDRVDDDDLAGLIDVFGSPVGLQTVETKPVREALDGQTFEGRARNYVGQRTYTYATPIVVAGVEWVAVADIPLSDARSPLVDFAKRLGLVMLVILPAAALVGLLLSRRLTRPIAPVVEAAAAIAAGERTHDIPDLGRDEFGDLARRLGKMSDELGRQESELAEEAARTREMLLTVLPPRLVDDEGGLVGNGDVTDTATVVAAWIDVDTSELSDDGGLVELLSEAARLAEELAAARGMERIRVAADHFLFLAGIAEADDGVGDALGFADELSSAIQMLSAHEKVSIGLQAAISTGRVATGMLERGSLTFAAWGAPVRRALAIGALAADRSTVVDGATADAASGSGWEFEPIGVHEDLDGQTVELLSPVGGGTSTS